MNKKFARSSKIIFTIFFGLAPMVLANCGPQSPGSESKENKEEGWIGVYVQDMDADLRRYLDLEERYGVLINDVADDSPAEEAGLREEDVIIRFDGKRIRNSKDLSRAVGRKEPGEKVKLEIIRDSEKKKITLRIAEKPRGFYSRYGKTPRTFYGPFKGYRRPWLGIRMTDLNKDLAQYFKVDKKEGVLILSVEEDSPAENSGLKAGDIITRMDGEKIQVSEDVKDIIEEKEVGDEIEIKIIRKGNKQTLKAKLERAPRSYSFYFDKDRVGDWKEELKDWKDRFKYDFKYKIKRDLESALDEQDWIEDIENDLADEMEELAEKLQKDLERIKFDLELLYFEDSI
jgi:C-terminal processing protease CtpA/Prc